MKTIKVSLILFLLFSLISCQESGIFGLEDKPVEVDFTDNFGNSVVRDFIGQIVDESNFPISGVDIYIHDKQATTDDNGVFLLKDVTVFQKFAFIKAVKQGYINGSRTLIPTEGTNSVSIIMLSSSSTQVINSGTTETIVLSDGSSITFNGDYVDDQGSPYSGSAKVVFYHLDPSDDQMLNKMPGMLYGEDADGEEKFLESFGMLAIELLGSNTDILDIAPGSFADILIPIDNSLISIAPSTIPLWFFDEEAGYWKENGQATLQGNVYVGTIYQFSFWNASTKYPTLKISMNATDHNGNAIANQKITLTQSNSNYPYPITSGYTNADGKICGLIPIDEIIELEALCVSNSFYNISIGPFTEDEEIDIIFPQDTGMIFETVFGNFTKCDGEMLTNGYVQLIHTNHNYIEMIENGVFEINLLRCSNLDLFLINSYDYENSQTTDYLTYYFTTPYTDLGILNVCGK